MIILREGLEAALIVGIVLGVLRKLGHTDRSRPVWAGVLAAVVVSVAAGLALNALGVAFEGHGEEIFIASVYDFVEAIIERFAFRQWRKQL